MLIEMGWSEWAKLLLALILFLGPGYGLLGLFPGRKENPRLTSKTYAVVLSFTLSVSFWAICLAWFNPLGILLSPYSVFGVSLLGWAFGLARQKPWKDNQLTIQSIRKRNERLLLWVILLVIVLAGLWMVRDEVAGPGSDSYHHTLFAKMILDQGKLPTDYQPVTDLVVTFSYHFGYHTVIAVLGWLSGVSVLKIVLVSGILWVALAALSVAFIVEELTKSRIGALFAALVVGLTCVFPAFMINWGRYPQLTGLILLPVWTGLMVISLEKGSDWRRAIFLGILSAGLGFSHYRVAQMAIVGFAVLLPMFLFHQMRFSAISIWRYIKDLSITALSTVFLFSPWIWHVVSSRQKGYSLIIEEMAPTFFQLSRLGTDVLNFPTNTFLLGLAGIAILLGIYRRIWFIIWLPLWCIALWLFSHPMLDAFFHVDRISVTISLYIPIAIAIGWLAYQIEKAIGSFRKLSVAVFGMSIIGLLIWSAPNYARSISLGRGYLQPEDLSAASWIEHNISDPALFMINLFNFPFSPDLIIGSDGGYWLPLIANRNSVSIPMTYLAEKFRTTEGINDLKMLEQLEGNLCTPEAVQIMKKVGITHVYIGSWGGNIKPQELLSCEVFEEVYNGSTTYVFRFDSSKSVP